MRHIFLTALLCSLFVVPASADPLQIATGSSSWGAQPNRGGGLGGGFIEFLAGGGARRSAAPAVPAVSSIQSAYQPAPGASQHPPLVMDLPPARWARPEPLARPEVILRPAPAAVPATAPAGTGAIEHPPVDPKFDRQVVAYTGGELPGTIIIDTPNKFLYLVEQDGKALRYGIGVGRQGFTWAGVKEITAKREWPDWIPPDDMLNRQPNLPRFMAGGPENPLGARAMYLGSTLYRIHGSNEPWTIGSNVSSGCIRLRNADVIDLYNRVKVGTKVVVM